MLISDLKILAHLYPIQHQRGGAWVLVFGKGVRKLLAQATLHAFRAKNRHIAPLLVVERAHFIQTGYVIHMLVGQDDGVQPALSCT